jgi:hypothetical protein
MLNLKQIKYRSEGKKLDYFGKPSASSPRKQECNTEVRAKSLNTSVNLLLQVREGKQAIPK